MKLLFAPKHTQALELDLKDTSVIYNLVQQRSELFDTDTKEMLCSLCIILCIPLSTAA